MVSIFSCTSQLSVCLLWRNVYLVLPPTFWLDCLFFWYWVAWALCVFWILIPCWLLHLKIFSLFEGCLFIWFVVSLAVQKILSIIRSHLFIFVFIFTTVVKCDGEGNGNPLQYSCLENPRDGGAWWAVIYGVTQSQILLKRLSSSSNTIHKNKLKMC